MLQDLKHGCQFVEELLFIHAEYIREISGRVNHFLHRMNHVLVASIQALARGATDKHTLAAMLCKLFHRSKINCTVVVAASNHEAHFMAFFSQLGIQDFNVGFQACVRVSFHGQKIARAEMLFKY